jgi:hypothetical protein
MNDERSEDLTREERHAFRDLEGGELPGRGCEDRIVGALRQRGLVRSVPWTQRLFGRVPMVPRLALGLGAVIMAFGLGVQYGKQGTPASLPAATVEPELFEEVDENVGGGGDVLVSLELAIGKPDLASLGGSDYGDFPPYPLDGRSRSVSPRHP